MSPVKVIHINLYYLLSILFSIVFMGMSFYDYLSFNALTSNSSLANLIFIRAIEFLFPAVVCFVVGNFIEEEKA